MFYAENACYNKIQILLSFCFVSKNTKINTYQMTWICMEVKHHL